MKPIFSWRAMRAIFYLAVGLLVLLALLAIFTRPAKAAGEDCEAHKIVSAIISASVVFSPGTQWMAMDQTIILMGEETELMATTMKNLGVRSVGQLRSALKSAGFKMVASNNLGESWQYSNGPYTNPCLPPPGSTSVRESSSSALATAEGDIGFSMSRGLANLAVFAIVALVVGAMCIPRLDYLPSKD